MPTEARTPSRVVIVGGGAGGLELAIRLARLTRPGRRAEVTLVDRAVSHLWKPRLHEIATGLLVAEEEAAFYAEQGKRHGFAFVLGEVRAVDTQARRIEVAAVCAREDDGVARKARPEVLPPRTLSYDTAVLAVGSTVNDFGTPGVSEHCYTLDDPSGAERLHAALLAQAERVKAGVQAQVRVAIVGAGSTGVELAGELRASARELPRLRSLMPPHALQVTLVEMGERPLPHAAPELSRYACDMLEHYRVALRFGAKVVRAEADRLHLDGGETVQADLLVWASGIAAAPLAKAVPGLARGRDGRIQVDDRLRVQREGGGAVDELYALGDCAAFTEPGAASPVGATAQAAHQQAATLARSLARRSRGREPLPFRYHDRGTLVSLGEGHAAGALPTLAGGLHIRGWLATLSYMLLYDQHLAELFGAGAAAALRMGRWLRRSARPAVKTDW